MLSKSRYIRGINCHKALWLSKHKKELQVFSNATMAVFARGTSVGELATQYFPGGVMAVTGDYPNAEAAKYTQELIAQGVETIYEATFIYDNTLVAVDVLNKENGKWHIYEVKSTNSAKDVHVPDIAVQYYVLTGCGLSISDASVMHFDKNYVRRGHVNVKELFKATSLFNDILPLQDDIKNNIPVLLKVLESDEPIVEMGGHCTSPYECGFIKYCHSLQPIIDEAEKILSNVPQIIENEVRNYVNNIEYPICHLDFETIMPGVPMFDESRPYQQIPFQYSIHFQQSKNSDIKHYEYLAPNDVNIDPRIGLIEQMIEETKNAKTIFVYHIPFERSRINEMSRDFPQYAAELQSINERLVDLIIPFRRKYYRTEAMEGSSSIKKVLPALCPELSYGDLEIGGGMEASNAFLNLYYCNDKDIIAKTRANLLKYCHLDTYAMVRILDVLKAV